jgi:hypothetical protein
MLSGRIESCVRPDLQRRQHRGRERIANLEADDRIPLVAA